jgi:hypothetical protein
MAEQVVNHDICGICRRLDDFIFELLHSQSANVHDVSEADQGRLRAYIAAWNSYVDWVTEEPELDLPETSPRMHEIGPHPEVVAVENAAINDCVRLLVVTRDELINSQSARKSTGLLIFDAGRAKAAMTKLDRLLENYISKIQPMDLPESSPEHQLQPPGRTGV